jgi:hypothetical protein
MIRVIHDPDVDRDPFVGKNYRSVLVEGGLEGKGSAARCIMEINMVPFNCELGGWIFKMEINHHYHINNSKNGIDIDGINYRWIILLYFIINNKINIFV